MDETALQRQAHRRWHIWTSDGNWKYATRSGLAGPGTGITVHGKTCEALAKAISQAEDDAARNSKRT